MTDKQIIIDGVDVSGCKNFYAKTKDCVQEDTIDTPCVDHRNCYYKQLKRSEAQCEAMFVSHTDLEKKYKAKEQECERWKSNFNGKVSAIEELLKQLDQLKAELTRANCQIADDEILQCDMREAIEELKAENDELKEELAKVRMEICNQCGEKDDYNIPCKQIRDLDYGLQLEIEENDKFKQTLTEIKEIAEDADRKLFATISDDYTEGYCWLGRIILQKISECEGNDEKH